jgi:hypothetical protein
MCPHAGEPYVIRVERESDGARLQLTRACIKTAPQETHEQAKSRIDTEIESLVLKQLLVL